MTFSCKTLAALVVPAMMTLSAATAKTPAPALAAANAKPDWRLVWSDEFNGQAVDPTCWTPWTEQSGNNPEDEAQRFTASDKNHFVKDGVLTLRALKETTTAGGKVKRYTSAQLTTKHTAAWKYARFEARIKVPKGAGFWPAFWMLPKTERFGGWPKDGEADIMEMVTREADIHIAVAHYHNYQAKTKNHQVRFYRRTHPRPLAEDFHTYRLDWTENKMVWFIDGQPYFTATNWPHPPGAKQGAPFDAPFYLLLNLSVGGKWSGLPTASTVFPGDLQIDYVRVYQDAAQVNADTPAKSCSGAPRPKAAPAPMSSPPAEVSAKGMHPPA
jgi:beta-glucanase (GH16 family)